MLIDDVGCTSRTGLTQPRCSAFRNDFDDGPLDVGAPGLREGADLPRGRKPPLHDVVTAEAVEPAGPRHGRIRRSEEHTSELQSLMRISYAVFCLKKKKSSYTRSLYYTQQPSYINDI